MKTAPPSGFEIRGVIEGFYGNPGTRLHRLELIEFIAARGMNTFVYAPKDDPLVRRAWREPYRGDDLDRLTELIDCCRRHGVELVYCVSPGLSIQYSGDGDLEALAAKLSSVAALGVRRCGLLLDDIPPELQHGADRAMFGTLAEAHAHLIRRVFERLEDGSSLVVCPTVYWGRGDEPYLAAIGEAIDPRVELFWTGRAICAATLDLADARTFARTTGRDPTYWDNYPVNDVAMSFELHIGPYRGRDPRLWEASRGVIANGMELFEASKIAFATIADYLRDPEGYEPEASWQRALRDVAGDSEFEAFAIFADNVRSSCLSAEDAPRVTHAIEAFAFAFDRGDGMAAAADLTAEADRLLGAAEQLLRGSVGNSALIEECRPWIEAFELGARALARVADLAAAGCLERDARAEVMPYLARLRQARVRVFGDALDMFLSDLTDTHVRPGRMIALGGGTL
ncbi:MAG: hyaluronoglucosaminidase [Chloroflexota bacterium]|nr:hyaluronoglucosaminidase [Chloroflexota bacterium]